MIKVGIYCYRAYRIYLKIINLWGNKKKIENIFYGIKGMDKSFIFGMPSLAEGGIFINIMILL